MVQVQLKVVIINDYIIKQGACKAVCATKKSVNQSLHGKLRILQTHAHFLVTETAKFTLKSSVFLALFLQFHLPKALTKVNL